MDVRKSARAVHEFEDIDTCQKCPSNNLVHNPPLFSNWLDVCCGTSIFDLYSQNPWVAGTQIVQIHTVATSCGLWLCSGYFYIGSVVYLYNVLRQHKILERPSASS